MEDLSLFPDESLNSTDLLIVNFDKTLEKKIVGIAGQIRASGISTEVYPEPVKLKKQMNYANKKGIPYVILAGTEELESGKLTFKDMRLGEQKSMTLTEILTFFKKEV
jgi:histidyl-tRNA synthetase